MKILLDTRWLSSQPSGIGMYVKYLMRGLFQASEFETILLGNTDNKELPEHVRHIFLSPAKKKIFQGLWKTIHFPPVEMITGSFDFAHYTNATAIPQRNHHYALTIHDLAYIDYPETIEKKNLYFLQKNVYTSAMNATHIITVSDTTKNKLVKEFSIHPQKITTIYNGIDDSFFLTVDKFKKNTILKKYNIEKKYFLSVSTIEPRKDFLSQIRAYKMLPLFIRKSYDLIIIGKKGWNCDQIIEEATQSLTEGNIRLLGYVGHQDLYSIFQSATAYLHTSLDEGFGIPIIQALASKTPVIASNTSCHPEILGKHGIYFEPQNVEQLTSCMEEICEQSRDQKTIDAAYMWAKNFSWEKMQNQTIDTYKKHFQKS